jgi:hypothetical protein
MTDGLNERKCSHFSGAAEILAFQFPHDSGVISAKEEEAAPLFPHDPNERDICHPKISSKIKITCAKCIGHSTPQNKKLRR